MGKLSTCAFVVGTLIASSVCGEARIKGGRAAAESTTRAPDLVADAFAALAPDSTPRSSSCHDYTACSACLIGSSTHFELPLGSGVHGCVWKPDELGNPLSGTCKRQKSNRVGADRTMGVYQAGYAGYAYIKFVEELQYSAQRYATAPNPATLASFTTLVRTLCGVAPLVREPHTTDFTSPEFTRYLQRTQAYDEGKDTYYKRGPDGQLSDESVQQRWTDEAEFINAKIAMIGTIATQNAAITTPPAGSVPEATYTFNGASCDPDRFEFAAGAQVAAASMQEEVHTLTGSGARIRVVYDASSHALVQRVMRTAISRGVAILNRYPELQIAATSDGSAAVTVHLARFKAAYVVAADSAGTPMLKEDGDGKVLEDSVAHHLGTTAHIFHTPRMACIKQKMGHPFTVADKAVLAVTPAPTAEEAGILRGALCFLHEYFHVFQSRSAPRAFWDLKGAHMSFDGVYAPSQYATVAGSALEFYAEMAAARVAQREGLSATITPLADQAYDTLYGTLPPARTAPAPAPSATPPSPLVSQT